MRAKKLLATAVLVAMVVALVPSHASANHEKGHDPGKPKVNPACDVLLGIAASQGKGSPLWGVYFNLCGKNGPDKPKG